MTTYTLTEQNLKDLISWSRTDQNRCMKALENLQPNTQEPVADIICWTKNGEGHAELVDWCDPGIEYLPDGEHQLYAHPAPQQPDEPDMPKGALQQLEPFYSIGRKWIAYAQREQDSNDIAVAVWSAIKEAQQALQHPAPQQKPLTDEQIRQLVNDCDEGQEYLALSFARAIEAVHNIKG